MNFTSVASTCTSTCDATSSFFSLEAESYVFCDSSGRFPTWYASAGFEKLFGYSRAECVGRTCADLISCKSLVSRSPNTFDEVAKLVGLSAAEVTAAFDVLDAATLSLFDSASRGHRQRDTVLTLGRGSDGRLVLCETAFRILRHAGLGLPFAVALQQEVSGPISMQELFQAAARGDVEYSAVLSDILEKRESRCPYARLSDKSVVACLYRTVQLELKRLLKQRLAGHAQHGRRRKPKKVGASSTNTESTACSSTDQRVREYAPWHLREIMKTLKPEGVQQSSNPCSRFLDLLEDTGVDELGETTPEMSPVTVSEGSTETTSSGEETSESDGCKLEPFCFEESGRLNFPLILADPSKASSSPIVHCNSEFLNCMGCPYSDVLGLSLQSLLEDWPLEYGASPDAQSFQNLRAAAGQGVYYTCPAVTSATTSTDGELVFKSIISAAEGRPLPCLVNIKQVELDDKMFLSVVLLALPDGHDLARMHQKLDSQVNKACQALAVDFFYSAPLRRQVNAPVDS
eukprot:TRINITY_DN20055_c0_g1_i1.p1 TRINITY_DN20055_c0_g1~~TRINITY_DN20055_c0_g1_i1.p1  ORF type:complete len:517 (-),score=87.28 TRINITY_DN20055_c0_g1_i1:124-1674(-)